MTQNFIYPPGSPAPILVANDLRKSYGPRAALKGLSFSLSPGHILGFLGPNGAGKTTAIRILTTILEPSSGTFTVDGISSTSPEEIRHRIGVLPESLGFPKNATALEYLIYFGQLYGQTAQDARTHGLKLLQEVGLQQRAKSLIGSYSRGMRQRLGIARSLVNDPAVVFLDEPTLGLDPRGQQELLELVRQVAGERNAGVILCSHALPEVESVCHDVVIMNSGQVVASGTVGDVIGGNRNSLRVAVPPDALDKAKQVLEAIVNVKRVTPTGTSAGWLSVELAASSNGSTPNGNSNNKILEALIQTDIPILNFEAAGSRLQDVFLNLTGEVIR